MRAALLVGGSSDIGSAVLAALLPTQGCEVVLAGRPSGRRRAVAGQFAATHRVHELDWDACGVMSPDDLLERSARLCDRKLDLVVVAVGLLGGPLNDLEPAAIADALRSLTVNLSAPAGVVLAAVHRLAPNGRVVVITSASATRPRRGIAVYSTAKQALDQLTRMAADTCSGRVQVHVVRPGHVRTTMTAGLPEPPLTRGPAQVARDVRRGVDAGRRVIWSPPVMRLVMAGLRCLPRWLLPRDLG